VDLNLVRKALAQGLVLSLNQNQALMRVTGGEVRRGGRGLESTSNCAYWNHIFGLICSNSNVLLQYACAVCDLALDVFRCNQKAVTCKILLSKLVRGRLVVQQKRANRNLSFFPHIFQCRTSFVRGVFVPFRHHTASLHVLDPVVW
jgi:hypothetical protein